MARRKQWSYSAGDRPNTVTVYEREPGGIIYARVWNPTGRSGRGSWIRRSLKHRDRTRAKDYALEQAAALRKGEDELSRGRVTLAQVFALYEGHRTPRKSKGERKEDARRIDIIRRAVAQATSGAEASEVVYVGDGTWDVKACRELSIGFVGRSTSETETRLIDEGAKAMIPDFSEPSTLTTLLEDPGSLKPSADAV